MSFENYSTNILSKELQGTIAGNSRARIVKTVDGRLCVIIDGIKHYADSNDLFGINTNPQLWLETFVKEYDKEALKRDLNAPQEKIVKEAQTKIEENTKAVKESRTMQAEIAIAISKANEAFWNFLSECGVHLKSALSGEKKEYADKLNKEYWTQRMNLVNESNNEYSILTDNCFIQSDIGKAKNKIAFNNVMLER